MNTLELRKGDGVSEREEYLRGWYASLCAESRQYQRTADDVTCARCQRPKRDHMDSELRCSLYATTTHYVASNRAEVDTNAKAIELLEKLAEVFGWRLI